MHAARDARKMSERLEAAADQLDTAVDKRVLGPVAVTAENLRQVARGLEDMRADLTRAARIAHNLATHEDTNPKLAGNTIRELLSDVEDKTHGGWCQGVTTEAVEEAKARGVMQERRGFTPQDFDPGAMPLLGESFEADGATWRAVDEKINGRTCERQIEAERLGC